MKNEKSGLPVKQSTSTEPDAHGASEARKGGSMNHPAPKAGTAASHSGAYPPADDQPKRRLLSIERTGKGSTNLDQEPEGASVHVVTDTSYGMSSIGTSSEVSDKSVFDLSSNGTTAKAGSAHGSGLGNGFDPRSKEAKSDKTLTAAPGKGLTTLAKGKSTGKGKKGKDSGPNSRSQSPIAPSLDYPIQHEIKFKIQRFPSRTEPNKPDPGARLWNKTKETDKT